MFFVDTTEKIEEELNSSSEEEAEDDYEKNLQKVRFLHRADTNISSFLL